MKTLKVVALSVLYICLLLSFFPLPTPAEPQSLESLPWGTPVDGLQMSLSASSPGSLDVPRFQVAVRNGGERDVVLNLGTMLANGKVQLPDKINLKLIGADGRTQELRFFDKRYPGVAGRVDDYVVPLRVGSVYTITLSLDQFWSPEGKDSQSSLSPGRYQITAQFGGGGATPSNLDMEGRKAMNLWMGNLQSNALVIQR